tara:strand:- start:18235 stop:18666 length:432 start_codon:yes stop_codon:yes gene_type:complete
MLLKRLVKDGIVKGIYKSSNILVSEYNQTNNDLTVVFKYGGKYKYTNVAKTDFTRFELAESQGKVLNSHIKKYAFVNQGKVDVAELLESVEEAEIEILKDYYGAIISAFKGMTADWDKDESFDDTKLDKVKELIKNYEDKKAE